MPYGFERWEKVNVTRMVKVKEENRGEVRGNGRQILQTLLGHCKDVG